MNQPTVRESPPCTRCSSKHPGARGKELMWRLEDLPCGCQDVHYSDGTACYEHRHVICNGLIGGELDSDV